MPAHKLKNHPYFTYEIWEDELFNAYAALARHHAKISNPNISFIVAQQIKSATFRDLCSGAKNIHDLFDEHKEKQCRSMDFCWYCGRSTKECGALETEHILPKSKGGNARNEGNIAYACHDCNTNKGTKDFILWYIENFGKLPDIQLLRMYLKNVYFFSFDNALLTKPCLELESMPNLPFSPQSIKQILEDLKKL